MNALINRLGGKVSAWLLSRPSHRAVGQANLRIAIAICGLIAFASIVFVVACERRSESRVIWPV